PEDLTSDGGWRAVSEAEARMVWGKGPTTGVQPGGVGTDPGANASPPGTIASPPTPKNPDAPELPPPPCDNKTCPCPFCSYDIKESTVSVPFTDTPVGYDPPIGPSAKFQLTYNQREDSQPANFSFFNVSPKWAINWLGYVTDDPANPGASVSRYLAGGGAYF